MLYGGSFCLFSVCLGEEGSTGCDHRLLVVATLLPCILADFQLHSSQF